MVAGMVAAPPVLSDLLLQCTVHVTPFTWGPHPWWSHPWRSHPPLATPHLPPPQALRPQQPQAVAAAGDADLGVEEGDNELFESLARARR